MPRFELVEDPGGNEELVALYEQIVGATGGSPPIDLFRVMGSRPDLLAAVWTLGSAVFASAKLTPLVRELVMLTMARHAECEYCEWLHGHFLASLGMSEEAIDAVLQAPPSETIQEQHIEVIRFVREAARNPTEVPDSAFDRLRRASLSEDEIFEIGVFISFARFIDTWAKLSGLKADSGRPGGAEATQ